MTPEYLRNAIFIALGAFVIIAIIIVVKWRKPPSHKGLNRPRYSGGSATHRQSHDASSANSAVPMFPMFANDEPSGQSHHSHTHDHGHSHSHCDHSSSISDCGGGDCGGGD